jgi:hypothetical protein
MEFLPVLKKIAANCSAFLQRHIFTRENMWAVLVSIMILLLLLLGTAPQPRFVYGGF